MNDEGGNASANSGRLAESGGRPSTNRIHPSISATPLGAVRAHAALSSVSRRSNRLTNSGVAGPSTFTHASGGGTSGGSPRTAVGPSIAERSPYVPVTSARPRRPWTSRAMPVDTPTPVRTTSTTTSAGPGSALLTKWALTANGSGWGSERERAARAIATT